MSEEKLPRSITKDQLPDSLTMYDQDFRHEVSVMYNVAMEKNLDIKLAEAPQDTIFMFSGRWLHDISNDERVLKCGHSGATEAYCFRYVRAILQGKIKLTIPLKPAQEAEAKMSA